MGDVEGIVLSVVVGQSVAGTTLGTAVGWWLVGLAVEREDGEDVDEAEVY